MKYLVLKNEIIRHYSELPICRTLIFVTISRLDGQVMIRGKGMAFLIVIVCISALWSG